MPDLTNKAVLVTGGSRGIGAAGVTPLDQTILSGQFHHSKAPLVLGNEGAGSYGLTTRSKTKEVKHV